MTGYQLGPDYLEATATCPLCGKEHEVLGESINSVICPEDNEHHIVGVDGKKAHYKKRTITLEVTEAYRDEDGKFVGWVDDDERLVKRDEDGRFAGWIDLDEEEEA